MQKSRFFIGSNLEIALPNCWGNSMVTVLNIGLNEVPNYHHYGSTSLLTWIKILMYLSAIAAVYPETASLPESADSKI